MLPETEHRLALSGLSRLNRWSRADGGLWRELKAEAHRMQGKSLRVLDIATGSGDLPIRLAQRARSAQLPIQFSACDLSETALKVGEENALRENVEIDFFCLNGVEEPIPTGFDVITVSLFLHHLSDEKIVSVLAKLAQAAQRLILINDLSRSWWNLGLVYFASRLLSRSRVVHFDGPVSVRAAFTKVELIELSSRAGLKNIQIRSQFPARWLIVWRKAARGG